jgi:amino acid transporter
MTSTLFSLKRAIIGRPMATAEEQHERLSKRVAVAVFSSDAISSTAYATEEILIVLMLAGAAATAYSLWVAALVVFLLAIVVLSYRQTVHAYPSGGGSYVVAGENLGTLPGLIAAASLLVDYVMTVAVSVASGVAAITSAFPGVMPWRIPIAVVLVILVAMVNLRGVRESGSIFAIPTYAFVVLCGGLIVVGAIRWATGDLQPLPPESLPVVKSMGVILFLRAFAGGCSAMTGTEAISNGVPAFKKPESRNAATSLVIMATILGFLFIGITGLAHILDVVPKDHDTVMSQIARVVYGNGTFLYYALQIATMGILVLASNTSFNGLPRLAAVMAENGHLPRQFMNRGDRLAFSNGIVGLALAAIVIIVIFQASVHRMIPLYAVGVFTGFTLSQTGMVMHWRTLRDPGWSRRAFLNGLGASMTAIVAVVIVVAKFTHGAWIVVIAIPLIVLFCTAVRRHYDKVVGMLEPADDSQLARLGALAQSEPRTTVVLFVSQVNELTARSLSFARALAPTDVHAVTIKGDDKRLHRLEDSWATMGTEVPLKVIESPYRELVRPAVEYVRSLNPGPEHVVTVIIPEFVVEHWWEAALHNQNAFRLKGALLLVPWVVVLSVPFHIGSGGMDTPAALPAATPEDDPPQA